MRKNLMKVIAVLCICISMLGNQVVTHAATLEASVEAEYDSDISLMFVNILTASSSISISGNTITGKAVITSRNKGDISITMILQKKVGSNWEKVTSWSTSASDAKTYSLTKSHTTLASGVYRISSSFTANGEKTTVNSSSITK